MATEPGRSRTVVGLLVLASVTTITLDARHESSSSPVEPLRSGVAAVLGPVEEASSTALRPITGIPDHFRTVDDLRDENAELASANRRLQSALRQSAVERRRLTELEGIDRLTDDGGYTAVPAHVVGLGPAQSFSRTVTIDVGRSSGVVPDLTVINDDGLVGRVIEATETTATVLLLIDRKSTTGGRLGDSMELGFLTGDGNMADDATLELSLVDHSVSPKAGDVVVSWGSRNQAPYVAGVPVGEVAAVHSSPAELTETATIDPYVDFSSLDLVAVVTGAPKDPSRGGSDSQAVSRTGLSRGGAPATRGGDR